MADALNQKLAYEALKDKIQSKQRDLQLELSRLLAGKTSLVNMFRRQSKEVLTNEVEHRIEEAAKEYENVQFICDIISVILGYFEIPLFKEEHAGLYQSTVSAASCLEAFREDQMFAYWQTLQRGVSG